MSSHKGSSREAFTEMSFGSTGCSKSTKPRMPLPGTSSWAWRLQFRVAKTIRVLALANHCPARMCGYHTVVFCRCHMSDVEQASSNCDGQGVSSVVGAKLRDQILDMEVYCCLRDREAVGNLLIAVPVANQLKHLQLSIGQRLFAHVLGKTSRHFSGYILLPATP